LKYVVVILEMVLSYGVSNPLHDTEARFPKSRGTLLFGSFLGTRLVEELRAANCDR